jgi:hypothetical protein
MYNKKNELGLIREKKEKSCPSKHPSDFYCSSGSVLLNHFMYYDQVFKKRLTARNGEVIN